MKRSLLLAGLLFVVGCGPTVQQYSIIIKNDTDRPMTVVLTKDGGPMDMKWLPPEDFAALLHAPPEAKVNGIVIPPGKTVDQTRSSEFDSGTHAILRVYNGKQTPETMVGISPGSPNREDVPLEPGENNIVIGQNGKAVRQ